MVIRNAICLNLYLKQEVSNLILITILYENIMEVDIARTCCLPIVPLSSSSAAKGPFDRARISRACGAPWRLGLLSA